MNEFQKMWKTQPEIVSIVAANGGLGAAEAEEGPGHQVHQDVGPNRRPVPH